MATNYSVTFKTKYKNTDFERQYEIVDVPEEAAAANIVRNKVNAINASITGGSANSLANLFVSDDYDSAENIGSLAYIDAVKIKATDEIDIPNTSTRHILNADQFLEDNPDEFPPEDQPKEDDQR